MCKQNLSKTSMYLFPAKVRSEEKAPKRSINEMFAQHQLRHLDSRELDGSIDAPAKRPSSTRPMRTVDCPASIFSSAPLGKARNY